MKQKARQALQSSQQSEDFISQASQQKFKNTIHHQQRTYSQISQKQREIFLQMVLFQKYSIRQSAQKNGIGYSTAKAIFKLFKKCGRIGKKFCSEKTSENSILLNEYYMRIKQKNQQKLTKNREVSRNLQSNSKKIAGFKTISLVRYNNKSNNYLECTYKNNNFYLESDFYKDLDQ